MAEPRDVAEAIEALASDLVPLATADADERFNEDDVYSVLTVGQARVLLAALRPPGLDRDGERMGFDLLARGLLAIAERPSWESVAGRKRESCRALKPYYDGFDIAARSRAERACDALSHANIVRPFTGEVSDRYRALPLAHEEKAGC